MAQIVDVNIPMDEAVKEQLEAILEELGMSMATGLNVFARAVIRHGGFPFEISQAYKNPYNLERIEHSRKQSLNRNVILKTAEELGLDNDEEA